MLTVSRRPSSRALLAYGVLAALAALLVLALLAGPSQTARAGSAESLLGASLLILIPAAFLAGVLSFLSPCTLPILPAYFAYTFQTRRQDVAFTSIAFFFGLATTMTLLGATATALGTLLNQYLPQITFVGGVLVIIFGVMSLLGKGFAGVQLGERPAASIGGSYLFGATFALGWTTCIGPVLGALLTLLATNGLGLTQGALLAFAFSLGLGAPLILVATLFSRLGASTPFWNVARGKGFAIPIGGTTLYLHTTGILSGLLAISLGILLITGHLATFTQQAASSDLSLWVIEAEERLHRLFGLR